MAQTGIISNIQRYSLQDGPGIRTTVFLKGCPLDCWWCHNPEGRSSRPEVLIMEARCVRCGECLKVCPAEPQKTDPLAEPVLLAPERCELCGECVEACAAGARQMIGRRMTAEEVFAEILKDRMFYEESKGGATFSGGEPLMQAGFLEALLDRCRQQGIHTAVDTCGFAPRETVLRAAVKADLVLYDIKFVDEALHRKFTGVSNQSILDNLQALSEEHPAVWVRVPIIPGVNDLPEHLERLASLLASLPKVRRIDLLPYHRTGVAKFKRLGEAYRLPEVMPPSAEYVDAVAARLNEFAGGNPTFASRLHHPLAPPG